MFYTLNQNSPKAAADRLFSSSKEMTMANLFDYLDWRGDIPFSVDPFNEVDSAVLSEMAYVDFDGIVPGPGEDDEGNGGLPELELSISLKEATWQFWESHSADDIDRSTAFFKRAPYLLRKMCSGARFGDMRLSGYVNQISAENGEQMSAVLCYLGDQTVFAAFRGTDDTMIGWKEDFTFSFKRETAGQIGAEKYLSSSLRGTDCPVRVGGHSKGGNFALYASAFCKPDVRNRITDIYTYDGPGFQKEVIETQEYRDILALVHSIVPEESLFGLLLETGYTHKVVSSSRKGIWQHDLLSWQVMRNSFVEVPRLSEGSVLLEKAVEDWIKGMSVEERKEFVDIFFNLFEETGVENLSELTVDQLRNIPELFRTYREMDAENRKTLLQSIGKLLRSGVSSIGEELQSKLKWQKT